MIVEVLVIQMQRRTQRGVNTHVQHVVNAVEVEKSEENEAHHPGENQPGYQARRQLG